MDWTAPDVVVSPYMGSGGAEPIRDHDPGDEAGVEYCPKRCGSALLEKAGGCGNGRPVKFCPRCGDLFYSWTPDELMIAVGGRLEE